MNKTIVTTVLIAALPTAEMYVPVQRPRPSREFINDTYMSPLWKNNDKTLIHDKKKSELRREALKQIRENSQKLDRMVKNYRQSQEHIDRLVENTMGTITNHGNRNMRYILQSTATKWRTPISLLKQDKEMVAKVNNRLYIEMFEI